MYKHRTYCMQCMGGGGGVHNSMFADSACACASMHVRSLVYQTTPSPSTGCIPRAGDAIHPVLGEGVVWYTRLVPCVACRRGHVCTYVELWCALKRRRTCQLCCHGQCVPRCRRVLHVSHALSTLIHASGLSPLITVY